MSGALGLVLGVAAGIASYYLVECPAKSYLNRHWGAPKAPAVADTRAAA